MPFARTQVIRGQKNLGTAETEFLTFRLIHRHELALPQRRKRLDFGEPARAFFEFQDLHSDTDRAGGNEDHLFSRVTDRFDLPDQDRQGFRVGQKTRPRFDYDSVAVPDQFLSQFDIFRIHLIFSLDYHLFPASARTYTYKRNNILRKNDFSIVAGIFYSPGGGNSADAKKTCKNGISCYGNEKRGCLWTVSFPH